MLIYATIIFLSALLLFLLQLITAKQILPWFGGAASVWITCLVFYQVALLLGYAYSDWITRRLAPNRQAIIHSALLLISLALLPIIPHEAWKPLANDNPGLRILALLIATLGLPYFLLSATSPLLQAWFVRTYPGKNPYRLFALSNLASMLALLGYPLVVQPWLTTSAQAWTWASLYVFFAASCTIAAWLSLRGTSAMPANAPPQLPPKKRRQAVTVTPPPSTKEQLNWVVLAMMGSYLLLAVTNHLTQNVASVPLLWVLPLSIYLLTFILCFDNRNWYQRNWVASVGAVMLCAMAWVLADFNLAFILILQISLFLAGLFVGCMFCHGELSRLRPEASYLTRFYLMVALGGALGSILTGVVLPLVLPAIFDLEIGLVLLAALGVYQMRDTIKSPRLKSAVFWFGAIVFVFVSSSAIFKIFLFTKDAILLKRNFYGALRVQQHTNPSGGAGKLALLHGTIIHGMQYTGMHSKIPTTFYHETSGIGRTLRGLSKPDARIGIIGLGVGTIASYGKPRDIYRFYEIDADVIQIANSQFTFLRDSAAEIEVVQGDARLTLEKESPQRFDVLVVDAFSGDAIPLHLMTAEAFEVYLKHLIPDGVIAFHVTNAFLDLAPIVQQLGELYGLKAAHIYDADRYSNFPSSWILLCKDQEFLDLPYIKEATVPIQPRPELRIWTDDFSNLLQALKKP